MPKVDAVRSRCSSACLNAAAVRYPRVIVPALRRDPAPPRQRPARHARPARGGGRRGPHREATRAEGAQRHSPQACAAARSPAPARTNAAPLGDVGEVGHHPSGDTKPALLPRRGQREMYLRRQHIRHVVQGERGLVREDAHLLRPEPDHGEVLVVAGGEVHEAVDPAAHSDHAAGAQMVREQLRRVAGLGRLLRREEPVLGRRDLEDVVPVGRSGAHLTHARTLSEA
jgi:hypothetical protein